MIFDTHTHYDDSRFDIDREALLLGMNEANVGAIVNMGATMQGAKDSVAMAKQYPFVYAAVGVHPDCAKDLNEEKFEVLRVLAKEDKVVAIGEIGLDYYWDSTEREVQKYWFLRQLALAQELELPIVIHSREAAQDTYEILKQEYEKQAVEEYCNSNYKLGKLNDQGQRINIDIKFEKNNRKIIFESGWMVRPKGLITNNTPLAD